MSAVWIIVALGILMVICSILILFWFICRKLCWKRSFSETWEYDSPQFQYPFKQYYSAPVDYEASTKTTVFPDGTITYYPNAEYTKKKHQKTVKIIEQ